MGFSFEMRIAQGTSLCPSMRGVSFRMARARVRNGSAAGRGAGLEGADPWRRVMVRRAVAIMELRLELEVDLYRHPGPARLAVQGRGLVLAALDVVEGRLIEAGVGGRAADHPRLDHVPLFVDERR